MCDRGAAATTLSHRTSFHSDEWIEPSYHGIKHLRHGVLVGPFQDRPTGKLGAVVTDNAAGRAVDPDQGAELTGNPCARQAGISNQAQAFPGAIVDHRQDPKLREAPKLPDTKSGNQRALANQPPTLSPKSVGAVIQNPAPVEVM